MKRGKNTMTFNDFLEKINDLSEKLEKISEILVEIAENLLNEDRSKIIEDLRIVREKALELATKRSATSTPNELARQINYIFKVALISRVIPEETLLCGSPMQLSVPKVLEYLNIIQYCRRHLDVIINDASTYLNKINNSKHNTENLIDSGDLVNLILDARTVKYLSEILLDVIAKHYGYLFKIPDEVIDKLGGFPQDRREILNDEIFKRIALFQKTVVYARDPTRKTLKNIRLVREPGKRFFNIVIEEEFPDGSKKTFISPKDFNLGVLYRDWVSAIHVEHIDFNVTPYENPEPYYKAYALRIVAYKKGGPRARFSSIKSMLMLDVFITYDGQAIFTNERDYIYSYSKDYINSVMDPAVKNKHGARAGENVIFYTNKYETTPASIEELKKFLGDSEIVEEDDIANVFRVPLGKDIGYLVIFRRVNRINIVGSHPRITIELPPNKTILIKKQGGKLITGGIVAGE